MKTSQHINSIHSLGSIYRTFFFLWFTNKQNKQKTLHCNGIDAFFVVLFYWINFLVMRNETKFSFMILDILAAFPLWIAMLIICLENFLERFSPVAATSMRPRAHRWTILFPPEKKLYLYPILHDSDSLPFINSKSNAVCFHSCVVSSAIFS